MMPNSSAILHFLRISTSPSHILQIQAQLILQTLHSNPHIAHQFINSSYFSGHLNDAYLLFSSLARPHVFICNSLIRAFSHAQVPHIPLSVYAHMLRASVLPNNYTFPVLFKSLADFRELRLGKTVLTHVIKWGHLDDIYVQNSLLTLFASCGQMGFCRQVFDQMPLRDVVSWTVLITGYRKVKRYDDALIVFEQMQYAGFMPNHVTMVNTLAACASSGSIEMGVWIHDFIRRRRWELDVILGTALIDMYAKCGRIEEGINVFYSMKKKNVFTWNVVIQGLAASNSGEEAVQWFNKMEEEGYKIDDVAVVAVLSACSHSGLVDTGRQIFTSLVAGKYGFSPGVKHYACMVDLFARAGCLDDAFRIINEMPFDPTKSMWGSLLAGCRTRGNLELNVLAAKKLLEMEPDNSAYYAVLSSLYAEMGRWSDVEEVRELMKERGLKKDLGWSSVEPGGTERTCYAS